MTTYFIFLFAYLVLAFLIYAALFGAGGTKP
jgi:hypothetical protein